ncbi:MAG TPA: GtrA family protein [Candidatus Caccenecus avistercoris]|nr:GtrA family protein [Candidatus Caccenecus avistercoris]
MKKIWDLYHKYEEIINYLIVGGLTTVISLAVKYGLLFTVMDASNALELQIAVIISWIVAVAFAYFANRIFVFHSKSKQYLKEVSGFVAGRIATLIMEMVIMWFFVTLLKLDSNLWVIIWTVVAQILVIVGNYVISKLFVFKK